MTWIDPLSSGVEVGTARGLSAHDYIDIAAARVQQIQGSVHVVHNRRQIKLSASAGAFIIANNIMLPWGLRQDLF
jgi:hypothetical protein